MGVFILIPASEPDVWSMGRIPMRAFVEGASWRKLLRKVGHVRSNIRTTIRHFVRVWDRGLFTGKSRRG